MRESTQRVGAALRSIAEAITKGPGDVHYQAAQVVRLGRMLRDNPLVASAIAEVVRHERVDEEMLAQQCSSICSRFSECFRSFANSLPQIDALRTDSPTILRILDSAFRDSAPATLRRAAIAARQEAVIFTPAEIRRSATLWQQLLAQWEPLEGEHPEYSDAVDALNELRKIGNAAEQLEEFEKVANRLNAGRGVEQLKSFANAWETLIREGGSFTNFVQGYFFVPIKDFVIPLIDLVVCQLDEGLARLHAIHRLRVLFEQFDYENLRTQLRPAEGISQRREKILQEAMDRFLFHEGFFPVTHAGASRGYLDTLLLQSAEASLVPPILIELKQVVSFKTQASRAAVNKVIAEARGEIDRYRKCIAAHPSWSSLVPIIVVVHSCMEDLGDLEASDVVLIDLSPVTPSRKRPRRIIDTAVEAGTVEAGAAEV